MRHETMETNLLWLLSMKRPGGGKNEMTVAKWLATMPGSRMDAAGNVEIVVGKPKTIFIAHMDTVHAEDGTQKLSMLQEGILSVRPTKNPKAGQMRKSFRNILVPEPEWLGGVLGADDAAGVVLLLHMIENQIPGHYLFTVQEEIGSRGMEFWLTKNASRLSGLTHAVSFDRRGRTDIVTYQHGRRMGSSELAEHLSKALDMGHEEADGFHTDNALLEGLVPEIVNISVGYQDEHSSEESLDTTYLDRLADAVLMVDWNSLPVGDTSEFLDVDSDVMVLADEFEDEIFHLERREKAILAGLLQRAYDYGAQHGAAYGRRHPIAMC